MSVCTEITIEHGTVHVSDPDSPTFGQFEEGSILEIECDEGYYLHDEGQQIFCHNGLWVSDPLDGPFTITTWPTCECNLIKI